MVEGSARTELAVRRLSHLDVRTLEELAAYGKEALGEGALDEWMLPVVATCGLLYAARSGEETVGAAAIIRCLEGEDLYMDNFYIRPAFRQRGYGRRLLGEVCGLLSGAGFGRLLVTIDPGNEPGQRLYGGAGFKEADYLPDHYGRGRHRLLLALDLKGGGA